MFSMRTRILSTRRITRRRTTTSASPSFVAARRRRRPRRAPLILWNATIVFLVLWLLSFSAQAFTSLILAPPSITSSRTAATISRRRTTRTASAAISWNNFDSLIARAKIPNRIPLQLSAATSDDNNNNKSCSSSPSKKFDLTTALLCGGLAFDAYVEPAPDSSRWERGSQGWQVAFVSRAYTRQLYGGLLRIQIRRVTGLPADSEQDDNLAERLVSGSGVDACVLVAVVEGSWKEDVQLLEREQFHTGVLDLTGAAHVSRSSTCWSTVTEQAAKKNTKRPLPYYVPPKLFGDGAQAVWPETEAPIYLYVQDPVAARLVWTVVDDARIAALAGGAAAVGSTWKRLAELMPQAARARKELLRDVQRDVVQEVRRLQQQQQQSSKKKDAVDESALIDQATQTVMQKQQFQTASWQGTLPLTSKPRKRDKKGQMLAAAAAGAAIAGPMGAAAGAVAASFYEGQVRGAIDCKIQYLPIVVPPTEELRKQYRVYGGMPGIDWGNLYAQYLDRSSRSGSAKLPALEEDAKESDAAETTVVATDDSPPPPPPPLPQGASISNNNDLEHCFFVKHQKTGAACVVYRSLEEKLIIVSFRGTCTPIDLITDASLVQEAWVEGEDIENQMIAKVHVGFRSSMNSIARRLKELILATPAPGDDISDYDMLVTGHSLGGAIATLFTADVGQYGIDAGRALPQLEPSEPWWKAVANIFSGQGGSVDQSALKNQEPPRPKSLKLYNFGSPRVGNEAFANLFDALVGEGYIDQAYRIVNGDDVVARLPRTFNAFVFGNINYNHVGTTVLISQPETTSEGEDTTEQEPIIWIEGESDDKKCPVRDGVLLSSPTAEGTLLNDLLTATRDSFTDGDEGQVEKEVSWADKVLAAAGKVSERMKQLKASDIASVVGIDRDYTDRELRMIQSIVQGRALAHHLEDEYYAGMGRASGFLARVGEELVELEEEVAA